MILFQNDSTYRITHSNVDSSYLVVIELTINSLVLNGSHKTK